MNNKTMDQERSRHEKAAHWCIIMQSGVPTAAEKKGFADWINENPLHLQEYRAVLSLWAEAADYGAALDPSSDVIRLYPAHNGATAKDADGHGGRLSGFFGAMKDRRMAAAFAVIMLVAVAVLSFPPLGGGVLVTQIADNLFGPAVESFQTRKGESRMIALDDGSVIELNTLSKLEIRFSQHERTIMMIEGEAYFDVAKDPQRPFVVRTDKASVQAVGTEFNVRLSPDDLAVTVVEGKVMLRQTKADDGTVAKAWETSLSRNEQAVLSRFDGGADNDPLIRRSDDVPLEKVVSWRQNKLIFEAARLGDVVADFNRYNTMEIILADEDLADLSISGVFDSRDPEAFSHTLEAFAPVEALIFGRSRILIKNIHDNI
ncbi:protein FecR [alpha proteobacterium Q-1]|nr:protein FecR [alpha proteobacterium Q-1]